MSNEAIPSRRSGWSSAITTLSVDASTATDYPTCAGTDGAPRGDARRITGCGCDHRRGWPRADLQPCGRGDLRLSGRSGTRARRNSSGPRSGTGTTRPSQTSKRASTRSWADAFSSHGDAAASSRSGRHTRTARVRSVADRRHRAQPRAPDRPQGLGTRHSGPRAAPRVVEAEVGRPTGLRDMAGDARHARSRAPSARRDDGIAAPTPRGERPRGTERGSGRSAAPVSSGGAQGQRLPRSTARLPVGLFPGVRGTPASGSSSDKPQSRRTVNGHRRDVRRTDSERRRRPSVAGPPAGRRRRVLEVDEDLFGSRLAADGKTNTKGMPNLLRLAVSFVEGG